MSNVSALSPSFLCVVRVLRVERFKVWRFKKFPEPAIVVIVALLGLLLSPLTKA